MKKIISLLLILLTAFAVSAAEEKGSITGEEAINLLKEGNIRFVEGKSIRPNQGKNRLTDTASNGQHPLATILSCSDSRVPIEILFDRGVGDLFGVRVAGNVADIDEIGSIEYGVEHLATRLLVVLGHSKCGAVTVALKDDKVGGSIPQLIDNIIPVAAELTKGKKFLDDTLVLQAVQANVWQSVADIITRSPIVRELIEANKLKVVGAVYHIENGTIEWLGDYPKQAELLKAKTAFLNLSLTQIVYLSVSSGLLMILFIILYFIYIGKKSYFKNMNIKTRMVLMNVINPIIMVGFILINLYFIKEPILINWAIDLGVPLVITFFFSLIYSKTLLKMFSEYVDYLRSKTNQG